MKKWLVWALGVALWLGPGNLAALDTRDLVKLGGDLVIEKEMRVHDAVAILGNVTVEGAVERNVVAVVGSILLRSMSKVDGDAIAIGGQIEQEEGAEVQGGLIETPLPAISSLLSSLLQGNWPELLWALRAISIITSIGFIVLALLIVSVLPKPVGLISSAIEQNTMKVFGWGLLAALLVVPAAVLLAISIIGLVLIPLEMILVVCAILMGYISVAQLLGKRVSIALRRPNQPIFWETLGGLIVLWTIGMVPILGWLVNSLAGLLGLGGVILTLMNLRPR